MKLWKKLLAICVVLIATLSLNICTPAAAATATAKSYTKGTVTATKLNVRSGPGKTYKKVGSLKKGTFITIISKKSGWEKVKYKNLTGYVYSKYVKASK